MIDFNEISAISKTWNYRKTEDRNGTEDSFTIPEYSEKLKLKKIGGKSVVWNQLFKGRNYTVTSSNVNIVTTTENTIKLNGTSSSNNYIVLENSSDAHHIINNHKYLLIGVPENTLRVTLMSNSNVYDDGSGKIYTASTDTTDRIQLRISNGTTYNNVEFTMHWVDLTKLFGAGNEPTTTTDPRIAAIKKYLETHPEYNEGEIIDSLVDEIEVDGVNLLDEDNADDILNANGWIKENGIYKGPSYSLHLYSNNNPLFNSLDYEENKQYTFSLHFKQSTNTTFYLVIKYTDGSTSEKHILSMESDLGVTSLENKTIRGLWISYGSPTNWELSNIRISKGTTDYDYKPYTAPKILTTNFPSLKSTGSVYDYIDFNSAVKLDDGNYSVNVVRNVGQVDLGSLSWNTSSSTQHEGQTTYCGKVNGNKVGTSNLLSVKFTYSNQVELNQPVNSIFVGNSFYNLRITVSLSEYSEANVFKQAMEGEILYYELATPTTETITISAELLEWLKVEYGGNMYYKQDGLSLPIPNTTSIHKHVEKTEELAQIVIDDEIVWSAPVSMFNLYDDDIIIDDDETSVNEDEVIDNE